jgi:hypothetical protein
VTPLRGVFPFAMPGAAPRRAGSAGRDLPAAGAQPPASFIPGTSTEPTALLPAT